MITEDEWDFIELQAKVDFELRDKAVEVQSLRDKFTQKALELQNANRGSGVLGVAQTMDVD